MTSPHALIHDEDGIREIPAADLIPGDIVCLEAGRQVRQISGSYQRLI